MPNSRNGALESCPRTVSPRLEKAVGDAKIAARIARIWSAPHAEFFSIDAPRQNVIRLAAENGTVAACAQNAEVWSLRRLIDALLPKAPPGLAEALRKLGDNPVRGSGLVRLVRILDGDGAKLIRHSQSINANDIAKIDLLPPELQRMRIFAQLESQDAARLLTAGAKTLCCDKNDERAMTQLAHRLERARTAQSMFRMLVEEIGLEVLAPPPIPGAHWFRPIDTVPKIKDAALRFRNCLVSRIGWLLSGHGAYYEVLGKEPAVVEIVRDHRGMWRLGGALGHANAPLSRELQARIIAYLEEQKVVIRSVMYNQLAEQLARAAGY